jgi:hypothetical protein
VNSSSSSPTPDGTAPATFHDFAEAQATATVRTLIAQAARPAQTELEALRVALDLRYQSLTATLAGAANIDAAPIRELVERLTHAASEEAGAAARTARTVALEEAEARLQQDRAEAQRQLDVMRAEAAAQRDADQRERAALSDAIQKATEQANAMQADRDAQLEALRVAREQGDAVRADRDVQLASLRAATERAEAIRIERDAHLEALRAAKERADAIQADRDAQFEALRIANERAEALQSDRDAQLVALRTARERGEALSVERDAQTEALRVANVLAETLRTERDAQLSAALAAKEEARTVLSEQDALLEAARISNVRHARILEKAQAQVDAARAELAAAQAEAERRLEVGAREIEALRSELERVRTEMELARAEAARPAAAVMPAPIVLAPVEFAAALPVEPAVEPVAELGTQPAVVAPVHEETVFAPAVFEHAFEPAIAQVPEPAVERQVVQFTEQTEAASAFAPVEGYAQDSEELTQPAAVIALPEPAPVVERVAQVDPAQAMYQAISSATDLSQVLDALVDGAGTLFPRAALFVVKTKSKRLQGWRSVGFTGGAAITREFELPLATDSALTRAVTASRTIFTGDGPSAAQAGEAWTVTFPVTTGGRVVAVVHADAGARNDETTAPFNSEAALTLGHTLVRMAGERIAALTMSARAAFGSVMTAAPVNEAPLGAPPAGTTPFNGSNGNSNATYGTGAAVLQHVPAAPAALDDAGRYAAQLVSEINRYSQAAAPVAASGVDQNLQERLADQIEGARAVAVAPAPSAPASALGLFDEALGKMLGGAREASVLVRPV